MATEQWPSPGRVVHYNGGTGACLAATVASVLGPQPANMLILSVLDEDGHASPRAGVLRGTGPGTWHWPEYVGPVAETGGQ